MKKKLLNYYLSNAIAFVKNKYDKEIVELNKAVKNVPQKFPYEEIGLDYTRSALIAKRLENYKFKLKNTSKNYLKTLKYFDLDTETIKEFKVYDVLSRLEDGISYT